MSHPVDGSNAILCAEGAVEDRKVLLLEARRAFDRLSFIDVADDRIDFVLDVSELRQCHRNGVIHDLEKTAAHELLVLHEGDIGFHARRIAVHHESDRAGRRKDGDLTVLVSMLHAQFEGPVPCATRGLHEVRRYARRRGRIGRVPMHFDDFEEGLAIRLVLRERAHCRGDLRAHPIGLTAHQRSQRSRHVAALITVVGKPVRHQQRTQIRIAEPERSV